MNFIFHLQDKYCVIPSCNRYVVLLFTIFQKKKKRKCQKVCFEKAAISLPEQVMLESLVLIKTQPF